MDGAGLLAESPASWRSLKELSLDGEALQDDDFCRLVRLCPQLCHLAVSFARELLSLGELAKLSKLRSLVLKKALQPSDEAWAAFFSEQAKARAPNKIDSTAHLEQSFPLPCGGYAATSSAPT